MFSIGELSKQTGVKIPTIRYYEQMNLIDVPERSSGNQRRYSRQGLARLSFIRHARELGLSIEDIRELVELSHTPDKSCAEAHQIASRHLSAIQGRMDKLKKLETELKRISNLSDTGHVGECRVIQTLADHAFCETDHKR